MGLGLGRFMARVLGNRSARENLEEAAEPEGKMELRFQVTHVTTGPSGRYVNGVYTPMEVIDTGDGIWNVESESGPGEYHTSWPMRAGCAPATTTSGAGSAGSGMSGRASTSPWSLRGLAVSQPSSRSFAAQGRYTWLTTTSWTGTWERGYTSGMGCPMNSFEAWLAARPRIN